MMDRSNVMSIKKPCIITWSGEQNVRQNKIYSLVLFMHIYNINVNKCYEMSLEWMPMRSGWNGVGIRKKSMENMRKHLCRSMMLRVYHWGVCLVTPLHLHSKGRRSLIAWLETYYPLVISKIHITRFLDLAFLLGFVFLYVFN